MISEKKNDGKSGFQRFLSRIERVGNRFPHPFMLFVILSVLVILVSVLTRNLEVTLPGTPPTIVKGVNLFNGAGFLSILSNMVKNFVNFPPLGMVLVTMIGVGVADESGLFRATLMRSIQGVPSWLITAVLVFIGINASVMGDAGGVIVPVLGAIIFAAKGRNPLVGVIAGYASVNAGVSACIFVGGLDVMLAGITQKAAAILPLAATQPTHPLINWYLLAAAAIVLTPVGTLVTEKIIVPMCGNRKDDNSEQQESGELTPQERHGLRATALAGLVFLAIVLLLTIPTNGILRDPTTHTILPSSPFMSFLVPLLFLLFLTLGLAFGYASGTIKSTKDIGQMMSKGLSSLSGFLVISFFAAQFIALFQQSNLATILAVKGTEFLQLIHLTGIPLVLVFVAICCFINLFMVSSSAKWIILAPIFVPMFAMLGLSPAGTLAAYRIGDSVTNIISPLSPYLPFLLTLLRKYDKDSGFGTAISLMLPYTIWFAVTWTVLLVVWGLLKIPLGPGTSMWM